MSEGPRRTACGVRAWRHVVRGLLLLVALAFVGGAFAQAPERDFDHLRTGFALSGAHTTTRCESCHVGGLFKGTPKDCAACHVSGARLARTNVVMNSNHIPTSQACESCHNTRVFSGARMNHSGVTRGSCTTCHNGAQAGGKSTNHVRTTASCDTCHATAAWRPVANFDHAGVATGSCASCHNGSQATGPGASHTPYTQVAAIASASCDSCHKSGFRAWTPARLHSSVGVSGQCATCHVSSKPGDALHAGQTVCENCHRTTTTWLGAKVDHTTFTAATVCSSCHNGSSASGKNATHVPVGATNCVSCHSVTAWKPTNFNHTQVAVTAQCSSCHTGSFPPADGKPSNHTPYNLVAAVSGSNCDTCHKAGYTSWTPATLHASVSLSMQCSTCHLAGKPNNAVHTGQNTCENCHKGITTWTGAKVDHSSYTVATDCSSCHNGSGASGKNATHVPVGATNCISCHSVTAWKPTNFNHTQVAVTAQCSSCHTGSFPPADGKPSNHTPYNLVAAVSGSNCDTCHKAGYTSWTPAKVHGNTTITVQCASCHLAGKPNNTVHTGQNTCENCHKGTTTWTGAKVDHGNYTAATDCSSCHNGSGASGKNATHVPVGATNCISCHNVSGWRPTKFNHTQVAVTAQCASCHTGSYPPADGKPAAHTPYQLVAAVSGSNCDTCHKAGYTSWTPAKVHGNTTITVQCASCHLAGKPNNTVHTGQNTCENCHKGTTTWTGAKVDHGNYTAATDCSSCHNGSGASGKNATHVPVGATNCISCHNVSGWKPTKFNHTQVAVTAQCASCHTGSYPPADGKPAAHTPYQLVAAVSGSNCDTCHKAGYTSWTPAKVHGNTTITVQCASCHLSARPSTPIHTGQTVCETCHTSTSNWATAKVDHAAFTAATVCSSCHNGSSASGKSATHVPVGATNCISCHSVTAWKPTNFNHTQVPVTAQCSSCHTGSFPPADGKPSNHTPYNLVAAVSGSNCDTCHKAGYTSWTPAKVHGNTTVTTQCATCHASAKPNTTIHIGQTVCENCHRTTTTWLGAKVDHTTFTAATKCGSCHNGSASGKNATHVPVGATNCISCHSVSGWKPTNCNHTQVAVTAQCSSCHTGSFPPADGKPSNHTPYNLVAAVSGSNCDTCHKAGYSSWTPAKVHGNTTVTTQCATCHASAKPNTTIHVGQTVCENCHRTTTTWLGAKVDHATFTAATVCSSCHNGSSASGKNATHVPVGATNCISCHSVTAWKPTNFNHTQVPVTAQCASCHTGSFPPADGKPSNHTPYNLVAAVSGSNCDTCHKAGYTSWTPAKVHGNTTVTTQCATCHASAKPNTTIHIGQTVCENCHRTTTTWLGAKVDHTTFTAATVCSSCHNGSSASGKNATHVPVGATNCISCHNVTAWKPTSFNHTQVAVTAQCSSCHTGSFPPADGKPSNHTPYNLVAAVSGSNCDTCHKAGYTSWTPAKVHGNTTVTTQCATCHASAKPNTTIHIGQTVCENCHRTTTTWLGAKVDHTTFTAATVCSSCHNGSSASGKNATHVPVGATNCISCHNVSGWKPTKFNHTQVAVTAQCASCHTGSYPPADGKPAAHTPYQLVAAWCRARTATPATRRATRRGRRPRCTATRRSPRNARPATHRPSPTRPFTSGRRCARTATAPPPPG